MNRHGAPVFTGGDYTPPITIAAAPGENRLVVIILRGAMDGLDALLREAVARRGERSAA